MTWLYRITTNLCLDRMRDQRTRRRLLDESFAGRPEAAGGGAEARVDVNQLLGVLPEESVALAVYLYWDEMTHEEIAAVLGCSRRQVGYLAERLAADLRERAACPA